MPENFLVWTEKFGYAGKLLFLPASFGYAGQLSWLWLAVF